MQREEHSQFIDHQSDEKQERINEIFAIEPPARWKIIYDQINGWNESYVCEWVRDETSVDGEIGPLVEQVYQARSRICERTGLDPDTDPDFCLLLRGMEDLTRVCGKLMYCYGYQDGINGE